MTSIKKILICTLFASCSACTSSSKNIGVTQSNRLHNMSWILLGKADNNSNVYFDVNSIQRNGNKVKMWSLLDFKAPQNSIGNRFLSAVQNQEYDCSNKTSTLFEFYVYSGNMGGGDIVVHDNDVNKVSVVIASNTVDERIWNKACFNDSNSEWAKYDGDATYTSYISYQTVHRTNNKLNTWMLIDYSTPQTSNKDEGYHKYSSIKSNNEYDCKTKMIKLLSLTVYENNMGKGDIVGQQQKNDDEPMLVSQASKFKSVLENLCNK